jgi:two-component system sensor kinase FixL
MQNQSVLYNQTAQKSAEKNYSFPVFDWILYGAALAGIAVLLVETRVYWSATLGITAVATLGFIVLIFSRQILAIRKNMEAHGELQAQKGEMRFRSLVEHSTDMITIRDHQGRVAFRSPSVQRILGYTEEELDGMKANELIHPDDIPIVQKSYELLASGEVEVFKCEYRAKHKNGNYLIMEGYAADYSDEIIGEHAVLVNSRDITDRKIAENQLRAFTARLEQSNRELQDFAYVASHDLQEPLRKVQAFGDRLNKKYGEALGDEGRDYVKRMRDAADRMQILINDLLTFSRVTTKAQPFSPVDLNKIANEVISDLEVKIEETGATVEVLDLPTIDADPLQMRQLLQNLIGNALKFRRPDTAPHVKIYRFEDEEDIHQTQTFYPFIKFAVEDNGIGFEEKYLDRIFTVFQRLHGRTEFEGSGVGLAVCRKIAERHGGSLTARSTPGKGSTFIASLPVKQIEQGVSNE